MLFRYDLDHHSLGSPLMVWCTEISYSDTFCPFPNCLKMVIFGGKLVILGNFRNGQNASLELISLHQTIKGDPNDGLDELEPDRSYLNHFPTWCAKCIHSYLFPCRFFLIKWANHISVDRTDINWDKNLKLFLGGGPSQVDTTYISLWARPLNFRALRNTLITII